MDMYFLKKAPKIEELLPVYALITTAMFIWSTLQYFWRLPSWFYVSTASEMFSIFAYMAVTNLIETLLLFLLIVAVLFVLPPALTHEQWAVKSTLLAAVILGFLIYRNYYYYPDKVLYEITRRQILALFVVDILILVFPFNKFPAVRKAIENLADRFVIFLYITVPLTIISIIVVIWRNLF
jgi:hypothetical protein